MSKYFLIPPSLPISLEETEDTLSVYSSAISKSYINYLQTECESDICFWATLGATVVLPGRSGEGGRSINDVVDETLHSNKMQVTRKKRKKML